VVTLKGFGDESADERQERVFAVAAVFGTEKEWGLTIREWLRRTRGMPFHATDCEADHGETRQASLDLYRDLAQVAANGHLAGFAVALNLKSYAEIIGPGPSDWAYFKALADVVGAAANAAQNFNALAGKENVDLEFTFDSRLQSDGIAGTMYTALANEPESRDSGILGTKISFEGGAGKSPRLEIADMFAHEAMKELDRRITGIPPRVRLSYRALQGSGKFRFLERDRDYWELMKKDVQKPESMALMVEFDQWLISKGKRGLAGGMPTPNDWFRFMAWHDNRDEIARRATSLA